MCELDAFSSHNLALVVGLLEFEFCHIKLRLILIKQSLASLFLIVWLPNYLFITPFFYPYGCQNFLHHLFLITWLLELIASSPSHVITKTSSHPPPFLNHMVAPHWIATHSFALPIMSVTSHSFPTARLL
jgi:hypothetical protein